MQYPLLVARVILNNSHGEKFVIKRVILTYMRVACFKRQTVFMNYIQYLFKYVINYFVSFFLFISLLCISGNTWSQQCNNNRPLSTPDDKYFVNNDGTITDMENGLTWMRCSVGQYWSGHSCDGEAKTFTWKDSFTEEDKANKGEGYAKLKNWRVPGLAELAGIVESQCIEPRINLNIFPDTPSAQFWTANSKKGNKPFAFSMGFNKEGMKAFAKGEKLYLRLVSGRN